MTNKLKDKIVISLKIAGDSGDGIQYIGTLLAKLIAHYDINAIAFPNYPADIRAPKGSLYGVSSYQISLSNYQVNVVADTLDMLVIMNAAALKANLHLLDDNGILIVNTDGFTKTELNKASYIRNPLHDGSLSLYKVIKIPITEMTRKSVADIQSSYSHAIRAKNMFVLGVVCWMLGMTTEPLLPLLRQKNSISELVFRVNCTALTIGYQHAANDANIKRLSLQENIDLNQNKKSNKALEYTTGNEAIAKACMFASEQTGLKLFYGCYPITPASNIYDKLASLASDRIVMFQAEDEIAAISAAIGASYGGSLAITATSGPGMDLKAEALGLAVMSELPLVIVDVQRAGPSTGIPTKTEQSDLLSAMYGRHGEAPIPILAPATVQECFVYILEAFRIAVKYMTPVIVLTDYYLANTISHLQISDKTLMPNIKFNFAHPEIDFQSYKRDERTLSRPWVIPGTKELQHCIGGLEKDINGHVCYDPDNHEAMTMYRVNKIMGISNDIIPETLIGKKQGKLLVISWGSTYGAILTAIEKLQKNYDSISYLHLRYLYPFSVSLKTTIDAFDKIIVLEINNGQLSTLIRSQYLVETTSFTKQQGKPFLISEVYQYLLAYLQEQERTMESSYAE